ncbi:ATP-dependent zinc protease [Vibrio astriarenae]|uniref:ATP-dependent zinc protease n=1 Tax=Vibrio astriarenae TaxID=1481923 RepID=A0A7Z2T427_9VIBR|nr:ATP-dependent zinc protease [Vibrio astriarenae]QIA64003.1 ATP-dependent zinc protease [Vibrio astriarenae]
MNKKIITGWREYLSLPQLGIEKIKAKVDTGARTSCIHAFKVEAFEKRVDEQTQQWVRFWVHPNQHDEQTEIVCEAKVIDERLVRDSGGHETMRYVIETELHIDNQSWSIEVTLTNRDNMAFRMLLGRTAMENRILVDPAASFLVKFEE